MSSTEPDPQRSAAARRMRLSRERRRDGPPGPGRTDEPVPLDLPGRVVGLTQFQPRPSQVLGDLDGPRNRCGRPGWLRTARLLAEDGPGLPIPDLWRIVAANCPRLDGARWTERCGVQCSTLATGKL